MESELTSNELAQLRRLSTIEPFKPDLPVPVAGHLIELGMAIELVEGGLQLTELGRQYLEQHKA